MLSPEGGEELLRLCQALLWAAAGGGSRVAPATSAAQAVDEYALGLLAGATISNQALAESTRRQRGSCWDEFSAWMEQLRSAPQRGPLDATPADIVAYCASHWTIRHGESMLSDGSIRPAPSSLDAMLCQLSGTFELHGRYAGQD